MDTNAVLRHRNIILDCLRDGDISIRRRALELSYALVNESNVRELTRELLAFLDVADNEFKLGLTTQICLAAERYAPNKRWHIDTVLRVLKLAGNYVREEMLAAFVRLVSHTPELQAYTASKLYSALQSDISQESLTLSAVWIIGEYGELLVENGLVEEEEKKAVTDADLVDLLESILNSPYANPIIRQFILTAITKISARHIASPTQRDRICEILAGYSTSPELEIQQRSVEFLSLYGQAPEIRAGVLEQMPAPEIKATVLGTVSENRTVGSTRTDIDLVDLISDAPPPANAVAGSTLQDNQSLLEGIFGSSSETAAAASPNPATSQAQTVNDILGLFGSGPSVNGASPAPSAPSYASPISTTSNPLLDLVGATSSPVAPQPQPVPTARPPATAYTAYDKNDLKVTLTPQVSAARPGVVNILAKFTSSGSEAVSNVNFQAAVPKTQQLQMLPMSNPTVAPGATETQQMRVTAPPGAQVRLRLRIGYVVAGQQFQEQVDFSGFPANLTSGGQ
ncbi:clathrin associated protein complex large subunit [Tulasnella sp. 419]|nr:clathrin associated protein complex large subunit [Tulasnella sp. 419]